MADRRAVLIGNQAFDPEASGLPPLRGAHTDVAAMAEVLGAPDRGGFAIETFLDATSHEILERIDALAGAAARDDLILIYYAGHGTWARGGFCLATANTRRDRVRSTSIAFDQLAAVIRDCPAPIVILLDCCYSGLATEMLRGDTGSAIRALAEAVKGCFLLTAAAEVQTAQEEVQSDGSVMGRFTAAIRRGLLSGEAARPGEGAVTFHALREWVEREVQGQAPQHAVGKHSRGDPVIADVPRLGREHARLMLLGRWLAEGAIDPAAHAALGEALLEDPPHPFAPRLRELLDRPAARAPVVLAAWEAATRSVGTTPQTAPSAAAPPAAATAPAPVASGGRVADQRVEAAATPDGRPPLPGPVAATTLAALAGLPPGLALAARALTRSGDWLIYAPVCAVALLAAWRLLGMLRALPRGQARILVTCGALALVTASAGAIGLTDDTFVLVYALAGLALGMAAWNWLPAPLADRLARPGNGGAGVVLVAALVAAVATPVLILLAEAAFGPRQGLGVARYAEDRPAALFAAALLAAGVVAMNGFGTLLRGPPR